MDEFDWKAWKKNTALPEDLGKIGITMEGTISTPWNGSSH